MKISLYRSVVALLLVVAAACASTGTEQGSTRSNPNLISAEEIQVAGASNVYDLIVSLRPRWLGGRGVRTMTGGADAAGSGEPVVYYNQSRIGGLTDLQTMQLGSITSIEFVPAAAATQRWGTGHTYGAIVVSTAAGRR